MTEMIERERERQGEYILQRKLSIGALQDLIKLLQEEIEREKRRESDKQ
jgi:uncharacterized small protein (DUF1192 family)